MQIEQLREDFIGFTGHSYGSFIGAYPSPEVIWCANIWKVNQMKIDLLRGTVAT